MQNSKKIWQKQKKNLERAFWAAANKLRGNINSSDYKYVVLGLIFIKYVSDAFETQFAKYKAEGFDETDEDFLRDCLTKDNIFYVPPTACRSFQDYGKDSATPDEVIVYAKLPRGPCGFYIPTPVGNYSPDWAISFKKGAVKYHDVDSYQSLLTVMETL